VTTESFTNVKKILEEYTGIFLNNYHQIQLYLFLNKTHFTKIKFEETNNLL
jgi:hypothetical protein